MFLKIDIYSKMENMTMVLKGNYHLCPKNKKTKLKMEVEYIFDTSGKKKLYFFVIMFGIIVH